MPEIGPTTRAENLERLGRDQFDVCIIGGGITGAGIALDAASRGLSVALVERDDFASGTSSKSSKLIHGGLRYLAQKEFALTWESVRERDLLRRLAPHLVTPQRFLYPAFRRNKESKLAPIGLAIYDTIAGARGFGRHRRAGASTIRELAPLLDPKRVVAAWTYYDARADDARLVFEIIRTAHDHGAVVANHIAVEGFSKQGGRLGAALARDAVGGKQIEVRARVFVNAAGVWAGRVAGLDDAERAPKLRPAKGIHLVVPASVLPLRAACIFPSPERDRRQVFGVPWDSVVLLGTTDTDYAGSVDEPTLDEDEIRYLLDATNKAFGLGLTASDVIGGIAGFRPLLDAASGRTADLSRRHAIVHSPAGLVTITGGKLTTYRRMAADATDAVCRDLGARATSRTHRIPIGISGPVDVVRAKARAAAEESGVDAAEADRLVGVYGDRAASVVALAGEDSAFAARVSPTAPTLLAEVAWAFRSEMAVSVEDALARRTRLALWDREGGLGDRAAIGRASGMSAADLARDADTFSVRLRRERGALAARPTP